MKDFEFAKGSVQGGDHRLPGKNCQDAVCVLEDERCLVAVVADGCGECPHSEVGAQLGAELAAQTVFALLGSSGRLDWEEVRVRLLQDLEDILGKFGRSRSQVVGDYFLYTLLIAVVTPEWSEFVGIGDGYCLVNGVALPLGPFPDNRPPYLAYALVSTSLEPGLLKFQTHATLSTSELTSFVIGTDGCEKLAGAAGLPFPGKPELVPPVSALWQNDRFFRNPDNVRRHLTLVNGGARAIGAVGHLKDDTTLVVARRRQESSNA
jgi:hypothetical protein